MAYFLRSPRIDYSSRSRERNLSVLRVDGQRIYVHAAPLVAHDRCVPDGYENHSRALRAAWESVKAEVRADHAARGEVNPRTGEGWEYPSPDTPRELVERLNAAGHAMNDWRDPISTAAGVGWDWCWAPIYSDKPDAPPCYWCGEPVMGRG